MQMLRKLSFIWLAFRKLWAKMLRKIRRKSVVNVA